MKKKLVLALIFILSTAALGLAQGSDAETTKMQEVMGIHDALMEEMPKLVRLIGKLEGKVDTTVAGKHYSAAIIELKGSNELMMEWMVNFGKRFTADEMLKGKPLSEQKEQWILEEEVNVLELRKKIHASIEMAKNLLGE